MKKPVKIVLASLAGLFLVVVLAAIILPLVVDPNDHKDDIAAMVKEKTGRDLVFGGDIDLSVFPWLGLELGRLSLSNAPGFGDAPMASVDEVDVKVKLLPLISKEVQIRTVVVRGLSVNLAKDASGRTNWDDLVAAGKAQAEPESAPEDPGDASAEAGGMAIEALAVGSILIEDAALVWDDKSAGQRFELSNIDFSTGEVALGEPFDFNFSADAKASDPALEGSLSLSSRVIPNPEHTNFAFKDLMLKAQARGGLVPGGKAEVDLKSDVVLDLKEKFVKATTLTLAAYGLRINGETSVADFDTAPLVRTSLGIERFSPRELMSALGMKAPATADPKALEALEIRLEAEAAPASATLKSLEMHLDGSHIKGTARATDFDKPDVAFDFDIDELDLDRYLPPESDAKTDAKAAKTKKPEPAPKDAGAESQGLPKDQLRKLVLDGKLSVGKLKAAKVKVENVILKVVAKDGLVRADPFSLDLYGGKLAAKAGLDVRTKTTKSALDLALAKTDLGGLLNDLTGKEQATGKASLNMGVSAAGETLAAVRRTLSGKAAFSLRDGAVKGFQIVPNAVRRQAASKAKKKEGGQQEQRFDEISASVTIKNGLVRNKDLRLDGGHIQATGGGVVDLAGETMDYKLRANLTGLPTIPFTVKGPLASPSASLDAKEFAKGLVEGIIKTPGKIGKNLEDVGRDAIKGLGDGLLNIFGAPKK